VGRPRADGEAGPRLGLLEVTVQQTVGLVLALGQLQGVAELGLRLRGLGGPPEPPAREPPEAGAGQYRRRDTA